ncbi:hypothetical protein [Dictyobacter arantiisoli]|uniref:Uncharacterized protein n=1 Tax=Dictyobacter arantiisoli TaxID=2014874 RepID=A0A5A5T5K5_9CHLR|nr:hypothetical protein [Dictyobacter arantiisoli]GCF06710.1 hypothetical protein KDI_02740 [Dictyobacter arantiisoli]
MRKSVWMFVTVAMCVATFVGFFALPEGAAHAANPGRPAHAATAGSAEIVSSLPASVKSTSTKTVVSVACPQGFVALTGQAQVSDDVILIGQAPVLDASGKPVGWQAAGTLAVAVKSGIYPTLSASTICASA